MSYVAVMNAWFQWRMTILLAVVLTMGAVGICSVDAETIHTDAVHPHKDLLEQAREWRQRGGMPYAIRRLEQQLGTGDFGNAWLENQLLAARKQPSHSPELEIPLSVRARTGIYLTIGGHAEEGIGQTMLAGVAASLRSEGWHAKMLPFHAFARTAELSDAMGEFMESELAEVDQVILIGFSVGAQHLLHWTWDHAVALSESERRKFKLMILAAGVTRGSVAAEWMMRADTFKSAIARSRLLKLNGGEKRVFPMIEDAVDDPWRRPDATPIHAVLPHIRVVQYAVIPEHFSSIPQQDKRASEFATAMEDDWQWQGPHDGMVETAAQILPAFDNTEQYLIRVWGAHSLIAGRYVDGSDVSTAGLDEGSPLDPYEVNARSVTAATGVVMDLLKVIPSSWILSDH